MRRVSDAFIGNTEAAEILDIRPANVRKMLVRYGVPGQQVTQGTRKVFIYPREEIERVQKIRLQRQRKQRDDAKG